MRAFFIRHAGRFNRGVLLAIILLTGACFRFYALNSVPPSPSLDEVSIGYNAFSILKTGKDEYGYSFPLLLRAYDDWRPGLYVYLVMPFISMFGLSAVAVRLPSVLLSLATLVGTYFFVKELFVHKKSSSLLWVNQEGMALTTTFLLAISPWHIYISRLGHEANLGLTAFFFGLLFFLKSMHNLKQKYYLFYAAGFFVLSLYGYQSQKAILPVVLIGLAAIYWKELWLIKKKVMLVLFLSTLFLLPLLSVSFSPQALIRLKGTSAFSPDNAAYRESAENVMQAKARGDLVGQIIANRRIVSGKIFLENYLSHFSPEWLFFNRNAGSHKVPNIGLLYVWEFPFLLMGFIMFLKYPFSIKSKFFFLLWFLSSPIAAAITTGSPHAMRAYTFLPAWQIMSALGIVCIFSKLYFKTARLVLSSVLMLIIIASTISLFYNYFVVFPKTQSDSFQYALGESIKFVLAREHSYDNVIFANNNNLYQSYMFFLFYSRYDPSTYQQQGGTRSGGYAESHAFGKYQFLLLDNLAASKGRTLYIGNADTFPDTIIPEKTFYNRDGKPEIIVGEL